MMSGGTKDDGEGGGRRATTDMEDIDNDAPKLDDKGLIGAKEDPLREMNVNVVKSVYRLFR
jgi:hypothetical protein